MQSDNENELISRLLYQSPDCVVVNKLIGEAVEGAGNKIVNLQLELKKILQPNEGYNTAGQALHPPPTAAFCGKPQGIKPFDSSLARPCPCKHVHGLAPFGNTEIVEAVHRLDVPVTGCALFALTRESLSFLNAEFARETSSPIKKIYWAIVEKPQFYKAEDFNSSKKLVHWIETNSKINKSFAHNKEMPGAKKASLDYKIIGEGTNYLFVEIDLHSGRHHQIRAQFAAIGIHIKGDLKYGAKRSEKEGGIRLHARTLSFPDPLNKNEKITVTANPPQIDKLWGMFLPL